MQHHQQLPQVKLCHQLLTTCAFLLLMLHANAATVSTAGKLASLLSIPESPAQNPQASRQHLCEQLQALDLSATASNKGSVEQLLPLVMSGVAFHNSSLHRDVKALIEEAMKAGE
jgi:replicative superfamily II helicase